MGLRIKTEKEFKKEFGGNWRSDVKQIWKSPDMDKYFGYELSEDDENYYLINNDLYTDDGWNISSDMITESNISLSKDNDYTFGEPVNIIENINKPTYSDSIQDEIKKLIDEYGLNCTVDTFKDVVNWEKISGSQKLSEDFIREFKDDVYWYWISYYQKLSENFIREFKDVVNWDWISRYQKLSEEFIKEFKDVVNWNIISRYQKLSEDFIREFKDVVYWNWISEYQKLSEEFIKEFKELVSWEYISNSQKLSEEFKECVGLVKIKNEEQNNNIKGENDMEGKQTTVDAVMTLSKKVWTKNAMINANAAKSAAKRKIGSIVNNKLVNLIIGNIKMPKWLQMIGGKKMITPIIKILVANSGVLAIGFFELQGYKSKKAEFVSTAMMEDGYSTMVDLINTENISAIVDKIIDNIPNDLLNDAGFGEDESKDE